jgi:hypothetical protein
MQDWQQKLISFLETYTYGSLILLFIAFAVLVFHLFRFGSDFFAKQSIKWPPYGIFILVTNLVLAASLILDLFRDYSFHS